MWELVDFERVIPDSVNCYQPLQETRYEIARVGKIGIDVVTTTVKVESGERYTEQYYRIINNCWYKYHEALNFAIALDAGLGQTEAQYYVDFTSRMLNSK